MRNTFFIGIIMCEVINNKCLTNEKERERERGKIIFMQMNDIWADFFSLLFITKRFLWGRETILCGLTIMMKKKYISLAWMFNEYPPHNLHINYQKAKKKQQNA